MPLETATYISQLVTTNPVHTDGLSDADAHMRLIKSVLKAQFPNFTAAVLSSTQAQIDAVVTTVGTTGVSVLADAGAFFKTNSTDGFTNPSATEIDVKIGGVVVAKFLSTGFTVPGDLNVTGAANSGSAAVTGNATVGGNLTVSGTITGSVSGSSSVPIGASYQWWSDTLPSVPGVTYAWLNGQAVSRATYAALFAIIGTTYGAGDGSTTFNLPDTREAALTGKGTMGATTSPGRITNYTTTGLGSFIGACLHLLTTGEMPSHTHTATVTDTGHTHSSQKGSTGSNGVIQAGGGVFFGGNVADTTSSATTGISVSNANTGGGGSHDNVSPSVICNNVMRIA